MGVQHGGQTQQKVVNVQVKLDGTKEAKALLSDFGKSVKNAMQGIDYSPYIKDQIKLIEDLKSAMDSFLYMKTKGSSNNVIRIFNALQATGFEDFKKAFEGYDISSIIDQANQKLKDLNATESMTANTTAYSVEAIANLRQGLELLSKVGVNKGEFLNSLMYDADAARKKIEELTKKVADLQFELEFSDKGKLDQLTSDLEKIRTAFKEEFANWLKGVGFDTDIVKKAFDDNFTGTAAGERMRELFREINEESLTASQAISRFGTEYAAVIKEMTGQAPENLFSAETVSSITALEAKFDELTKKLDDLIASAGQGGSVIEGVASESIKAVNGVESSISSVNTTALKDLLEVLKTVVNESSQFTEGQAASKHAILEILESLQAFDGIDVEKLTRVAGSLSSLNSILRTFSTGSVKVTGLTSIAKFVTTISNDLQNPANLSLLSDIKLDGFNNIKTGKSLDSLANFITKIAGAQTIPDLTPLSGIDLSGLSGFKTGKSLEYLGDFIAKIGGTGGNIPDITSIVGALQTISTIPISRGFNGLAASMEQLLRLISSKKFDNLGTLKDKFDLSGIAGNIQTLDLLAGNASRYASALQQIADLQERLNLRPNNGGGGGGRDNPLNDLDENPEDTAYRYQVFLRMLRQVEDALTSANNAYSNFNNNIRNNPPDANAVPALNRMETAVGNLNDFYTKLSERLDRDGQRSFITEADVTMLLTLQEKISRAREELGRYNIQVKDAKRDASWAEKTLSDFKAIQTAIEKARNSIANLNPQLNNSPLVAPIRDSIEALEGMRARMVSGTYTAADASAFKNISNVLSVAVSQLNNMNRAAGETEKKFVSSANAILGMISNIRTLGNAYEEYSNQLNGDANAKGPLENYKNSLEELRALQERVSGSGVFTDADMHRYKELQLQVAQYREELEKLLSMANANGTSARAVEQLNASLTAVSGKIKSLQSDSERWTEKLGENEFSSRAARMVEDLKKIQAAIVDIQENGGQGKTPLEDLMRQFDDLRAKIAKLQQEASEALKGAKIVEGSREQVDALNKVSTAISDLDKKMANMSAARTGKSAGDYRELMRLRAEYDLLREKVEKCQITEEQFRTELSKIGSEVRQHTNAIEMAGEATKTFGDRILEVASKLSSWISPMRIIMYVIRTIKQMISTSIELDSAMTQLRVVTKASADDMREFGEQTAKTAAEIGASIKDLIDSTTVFARLGYSMDESSLLAKYTAMLKQVGDIDISDAQNAVTAITKAFSDEIKIGDIESVMDRLVQVGNHFPISVSQIAIGMNNVSSTLAAAGNSFNESVALLTAANAVVQDVNKASTGLRTIAARLRNTKTELDELGETMETAKYQELVQALTDMNVSLVDINGEYRSTYDIMKDIAAQWDTMTSMEQAALITQIAGVRQQSIFSAVVSGFQEASGAMEAMENSVGSLSSAYDEYLESTQAHLDQFQAKFQDFGQSLFDSSSMSEIIDLGSGIMDVVLIIGKLIEGIGGLKAMIIGLTGSLAALNAVKTYKRLQDSYTGINLLADSILDETIANETLKTQVVALDATEKKHLITVLQERDAYKALDATKQQNILSNIGLNSSIASTGAQAQKASVGIGAMWSGMSKIGKISAILSVISLVTTIAQVTGLSDAIKNLFKSTEQRMEEAKKKIGEINTKINSTVTEFQNLKKSAEGIIDRFVELSGKAGEFGSIGSLSTEEYKEYIDLSNQLASLFPKINLGMDMNGKAMLAISGNADTLTQSLLDLVEAQRLAANQKIAEALPEQFGVTQELVTGYESRISELKKQFDEVQSIISDTNAYYNKYGAGGLNYGVPGMEILNALFDPDRVSMIINKYAESFENESPTIDWIGILNGPEVAGALAGLEKQVYDTENRIAGSIQTLMPGIIAQIQTSIDFSMLDETQQNIALAMVKGLDLSELWKKGLDTAGEIEAYIIENIIDGIENAGPNVEAAISKYFDLTKALKSGEITAEEFTKQIESIFRFLNGADDNTLVAWLNALGIEGNSVSEVLDNLAKSALEVGNSGALASASMEGFADALKNLKTNADLLNKAEQEMVKGEGLSPETIASLAAATDNYLDYLYEENGVIKLNTEAWKEYMLQAEKSRLEGLKAERDRIQEALNDARSKIWQADASPSVGDDIQKLEGDLKKVETQIAVVEGSIDYYLDQTDEKFNTTVSNIKSYYDFLTKAKEEMANGAGLSADTVKTLMGFTQDYQKYLVEEDGVIKLLTDDWEKFIGAQVHSVEESKEAISSQISAINDYRNAVASGDAKAIEKAFPAIKKYADEAGVSVEDFVESFDDLDKQNKKLEVLLSLVGSIKDAADNLNSTQVSIDRVVTSLKGLDTLGKIYKDVQDGEAFDFSSLISDDFVDAFKDCGDAYTEFIDIVSKSPKDISACQRAFDNLAETYILNSGVLDGLTEENRDYTVSLLEQNGVTEAAAIVDAQLRLEKELLANASADHANNMLAEIANSDALANASGSVREILARLALSKIDINKATIKTRADIDNLESLASAANASMATIQRLAKVKALIEKMETIKVGNGMTGRQRAAALAAIQDEINELLRQGIDYSAVHFTGGSSAYTGVFTPSTGGSGGGSGGGSTGSSTGSGSSDKVETWFEKQIKEHQHLVAMDKETLSEYTEWLDTAFRRAYKEGLISLDEFNKYEEEIYENRQQIFEGKIDQMERRLEQLASAGANPNVLVNGWRNVLTNIEAEIQRYLDAGYSMTDEVVQGLVDRAAEARDNIIQIANEALDGIQDVYDTLTKAAEEYNESGYLSVDTYQAILELGPKYLQYLKDENGQLVVNEQAIQKVMKVRIQELALDQALMYAKEILNATNAEDIKLLEALTKAENDRTATTWGVVEATIAQARAIGIAHGISEDYYDDALEHIRAIRELADITADTLPDSLNPSDDSSDSTDKEETWFEKRYKEHQHMLNMQQESDREYMAWLQSAYKRALKEGIITEEEALKYEEEVFSKRQSAFSDYVSDMQFEIDRLAETDKFDKTIQSKWEEVLKRCYRELEWYTANGYDMTDSAVQDVLSTIDTVRNNMREAFKDGISDLQFQIDEQTALGADPNRLVNAWRNVLGKLQDELKKYIDEGYSVNSDVVQDLIQQIRNASNEIISIANDAVDGIQDVYSTFTSAAKEWATTGYLSVDSYQSILELGPKYLDMLKDEHGHLVVNEKQLQKVLALRVRELAIDQAMVYARQVQAAAERNDAKALEDLTKITTKQTASTWELVYATLGFARAAGEANGMSMEAFDNAEEYVNRIRQLSITTISTIGESYMTLNDDYITQADALQSIISYTKELVKWENEQHIKAIQDQVAAYKKIIDEKKESLRLSKEQDDHDRQVSDKVAEIAKLQAQIDQLSLDDSREARAQRAALEEQLAEKQRDLADSQSDYAYNQQTAALDKEYEAFEEEKNEEIKTLQDLYQSEEKLYNAVISRIKTGWEDLYGQLIGWNTNYGNVLNDTITTAWNQAAAAVQRYGSFLGALEGVGSHTDLGPSSYAKDVIFAQMRENSLQWFSSNNAGRKALHAENMELAEQYYRATGSKLQFKNNTWYDEFGMRVYEFTKEEIVKSLVNAMKQNAAAWKDADSATRSYLSKMNETLAKRLESVLGERLIKKSGVWYLPNGKRLFDVYHSGGIAGNAPTLKQNEVLAVLEKGEAILDKRREESLYKIVDFAKVLSDKLGSAVNLGALSPAMFGGFRLRPGATAGELPFNINNATFHTNVSVQINHSGAMDRNDAERFGKQVADATITKINEAFTKRGVSSLGSAFLKS